MDSRAARTITLFALRCLRRRQQLHPGLEKQQQVSSSRALSTSCSSSSVGTRIDRGGSERGNVGTKLFDLGTGSFESAEKFSLKFGTHGQMLFPLKDVSEDQGSMDMINGRAFLGFQQRTSETIAVGVDQGTTSIRDHDFLSRYLLWRGYDKLARSQESQNYSVVAGLSAVGMNGLSSITKQSCSESFSRFFSCPSYLHQEHTMIIPLEADSVKRKRKKKMNKHKQRKLRRRDRHRN